MRFGGSALLCLDVQDEIPAKKTRRWWHWAGWALLALLLLAAILHRPLLQTVARRVLISVAEKQNLKVQFRLEGSMLGDVTLRNVRATATGPSAVQMLEAGMLRVDYSLWGFATEGMSGLLQTIEARDVTAVLDPAKAPPSPELKKKEETKFSLPAVFPRRLLLSDVSLRLKADPHDFILGNLFLDLHPRQPGELRVALLQLANGKSWQNVTATTSYENRNLVLRNLVLDDGTRLDLVNLDASRVDEGKLDVKFDGLVGGGRVGGSIALGEKGGGAETTVDFNVQNTSLAQVGRSFGREDTGVAGEVDRLSVKGRGRIDRPETWSGAIAGEIRNLEVAGATFDRAVVDLSAADGQASISNVTLSQGSNNLILQGSAELPEKLSGFGRAPANIQLRGVLPDLGEVTARLPQPVTGSAEINGQVKVEDETLRVDVVVAGGPIDFGEGSVQRLLLKVEAARKMPQPGAEEPYYTNLTSEISVDATGLRARAYAVDSVEGRIRSRGENVSVEQLLAVRGANRVTLAGTYVLPRDFARAASQPGTIDLAVSAPSLGEFWVDDSPDRVTGAIDARVAADFREGLGDGYFNLLGSNLEMRKLTIEQFTAQGTTGAGTLYLNDLTARLHEQGYIIASGQVKAEKPFPYEGRLLVDVDDLSRFEPVLRALGNKAELAGALEINWAGKGIGAKFEDSGELKLELEGGRYGDLRNLKAKIEAAYTPEALNVPIIFASSDEMMFQASMATRDNALELSEAQVYQGESKYAVGYASVPLVWQNIGTDRPLLRDDGDVSISFQSENLDIEKLFQDFGKEAPVKGAATIVLEASGPLSDLRASLDLKFAGLRSEQYDDLQPATFDIQARLEDNQLAVDGKLVQARIEPVTLEARLPMNVAETIQRRSLPDNIPLSASVKMPRSSMNFVRQFVPALQRVDGDMAFNLDVTGTVRNPTLRGSAEMHINVARMANATLPSVSNFDARLVFDGDTLTFQTFKGELAGGPFTLSGQVRFPTLTEPVFDLALKADSILVARNDDLTARTDATLTFEGPLNSVNVVGEVALTNSHFLKNIDLIPIGLPGRPPPRPQPPAAAPEFAFPNPPLRDWTFDVIIRTKEPFSIRGNLAQGGAIVDMKLTGTGAEPALQGTVRLENLEATLPFSRLEINQGSIYFKPDDILNPSIELQGTSVIRDYTVRVYVYGTALAPEAVFSSEPPLPQEEIISLLATGTTREELLGNSNVLAGRAAMLLLQQLYRKIFKKGDTQQASTTSVLDRLDLDVGRVDPRTGQQTATARYRVNRNFVLIGDIGVEGDFRGMVKYLIRFR